MLRMAATAPGGFSLIELVVVLAMTALILTTAAPPITTWVANARVRSIAEQLGSDLRQAQGEALRRNRSTVLGLTEAATPALNATAVANGRAWVAQAVPLLVGETVDDTHFIVGSAVARQYGATVTGPAVTCFNSVGRLATVATTGLGSACAAPASATTPVQYVVTAPRASRPLRVELLLGGKIRLCDPSRSLASGAPDGC